MVLASGTKIGPYVISSLLGSGGMGEVYRARDTRLDRDVAIKVLPAQSAADVDRRARFEREAKAIAALSHPNILAIFDTGFHDGQMYVVTELLNGETLRSALGSGFLPVRKATDIAIQIARGLAAAHEREIVHRDLKPENVFILADGHVKILDFGLARQIIAPAGSSQTAGSVTDPGAVMGTVGYMAPEQVRGLAVDARSDLFALGAVLYEMLSGNRAFTGETATDTLFAIVKQDPRDLTASRADIPPALNRIVSHCLEKNPAERFQSARDVAFALEALSGTSISSPAVAVDNTPMGSGHNRLRLLIAGIIAAAILAAFWLGRRTSIPAASPPIRTEKKTFEPQTVFNARFAPDGQTIIFSSALQDAIPELFVIRPGAAVPQKFGPPRTHLLSVSSKGELAVLTGAQFQIHRLFTGTLSRMSLDGEPRQWLENVRDADWSPDGSTLAVVRMLPDGKDQLEYPIGTTLYQTPGYISDVRVSPDGSRVAFMDHQVKRDDRGWIRVADRSGHVMTLAGEYEGEEGLAWGTDGDTVYFSASFAGADLGLFAVSQSHLIVRSVLPSVGSFFMLDIGANGQSLIAREDFTQSIRALLPGADREREFPWLNSAFEPLLSRDGKLMVFTDQSESAGANYAVAMRRADGSPAVRLGNGSLTGLSPDGRWAAGLIYKPPSLVAYPTGAGDAVKFDLGKIELYGFGMGSWFPDSRRLVQCGNEPGKASRCYAHDIRGGPPQPVTPEGTTRAVVSPDGKSIAAVFTDHSIKVWQLEGGTPQAVPGLDAEKNSLIGWTDDGSALMVHGTEVPAQVSRVDFRTGKRVDIRTVAPPDRAGLAGVMVDSTLNDGRYYAYSYEKDFTTIFVVTGMR
jgi:eukaryotic-like serine/threonine-protein kinase